jgi:SAM-dependent methyltransferase
MERLQDRNWLIQKYNNEQLSMAQIGELLGVSRYPVYRALKKFGVEARAHTSKYSELNDKKWLYDQHHNKGKSIRQIADEIGATAGAVQSALAHSPSQVSQSIQRSQPAISKKIQQVIDKYSAIKLDIGCGKQKQPGFVGIDYRNYDGVDIVHNLEETPWPLPSDSVMTAIASHVLEHINPHGGVFLNVMDEIWRIVRPDGQFAFVVPYAGSPGYWQDPTHCNGITEATILYFDPDPEGRYAGPVYYQFYEPKPWKIEKLAFNTNGNLECVLRKRRDDSSYHQAGQLPNDVVEEIRNNAKVEPVRQYFVDKY